MVDGLFPVRLFPAGHHVRRGGRFCFWLCHLVDPQAIFLKEHTMIVYLILGAIGVGVGGGFVYFLLRRKKKA